MHPALTDEAEVARYKTRATDVLALQVAALRKAIRYRNPETGRRTHAHEAGYRHRFVMSVRAMRAEIRSRLSPATITRGIDP